MNHVLYMTLQNNIHTDVPVHTKKVKEKVEEWMHASNTGLRFQLAEHREAFRCIHPFDKGKVTGGGMY